MNLDKLKVFIPAGYQQIFAKQGIFKETVCKEAIDAGIKLGLNLVALGGFPDNFDPASMGCDYSVHAPNGILSDLLAAEICGDKEKQEKIWKMFEKWGNFSVRPDHFTAHLAGFGTAPTVDQLTSSERFNSCDPAKILELLEWNKKTVRKISEIIPMLAPETVALPQYAVYDDDWLPTTFLEFRSGIYKDLLYCTEGTDCYTVTDFEHGSFSTQLLNRRGIEYDNLPVYVSEKHTAIQDELLNKTGIVYQEGQIPYVPGGLSLSDLITTLKSHTLHIGGLNPSIMPISDQEADNDYHKHLKEILSEELYNQVKNRRIGSHASVGNDEPILMDYLRLAIKNDARTLVVETCDRGEGAPKNSTSPGCWYWADKDAQYKSYLNLVKMITQIKREFVTN